VACIALNGGCLHVHRDANGNIESLSLKVPEKKAPVAGAPDAKVDPSVVQASATGAVPPTTTASVASLAKLAGKSDMTKGAASAMALAWQNKVSYQPDVVHAGEMQAALIGQFFLYDPGMAPAVVNGTLVIEMFDMTDRKETETGPRIGGWTLDKESVKKLTMKDEKFGKCYALCLPWPDYKPESYTRVKLTARYEPEHGYPLFARASILTFDNEIRTPLVTSQSTVMNGPANFAPLSSGGFMGPSPGSAQEPFTMPALNPVPISGRSATGASGAGSPAGLPPLVVTLPGK
jgi:hypothetical protein